MTILLKFKESEWWAKLDKKYKLNNQIAHKIFYKHFLEEKRVVSLKSHWEKGLLKELINNFTLKWRICFNKWQYQVAIIILISKR